MAITPYLLVVNPQVQARNLNEFLALAKSQPGKLNYASAGNGTATHLAMEMLGERADIVCVDLVEVNPVLDHGNATGLLAVELAQSLFGKRIL